MCVDVPESVVNHCIVTFDFGTANVKMLPPFPF